MRRTIALVITAVGAMAGTAGSTASADPRLERLRPSSALLEFAGEQTSPNRTRLARAVKTLVFVGRKRFGYIQRRGFQRPGDPWWAVSWAPDEGGVAREEHRWFFSYCEGSSPRDRYGVAQPQSGSIWIVKSLPRFRPVGTLRKTRSGWDIFTAGVLRASARGPHGVAAGLAYLTLRICW